ncbi:MAG TPA: lysylphosphatidylglycerol synthase transmembrane domain-containing protein, partial [Chloroflexota bacterium]|nr:lysylphosphatidylglycerol synthase transmembrane domain-containing protein [Chloroflexota bacterium]
MGQTVRIVAGIVISILFLFWAKSLVGNLGNALASLGTANYIYVVPALVAYFAGVWLRAARWHFLLRPVKSIKTKTLFPIVVIGYMANDVLPARLGEVVRAYILGEQERVPKTTALATILVERMFDGISMLIFVAVVGLVVPLNDRLSTVVRVATIIFIVALIVLVVASASRQRAVGAIAAI